MLNVTYNITYHWSYINYNITEYLYFCKMTTFKTSLSISPRGWKFSVFSPKWKVRVSQKKFHTRVKFHLRVICLYESRFHVTKSEANKILQVFYLWQCQLFFYLLCKMAVKGFFYILAAFSSFTENVSVNFKHKNFKS